MSVPQGSAPLIGFHRGIRLRGRPIAGRLEFATNLAFLSGLAGSQGEDALGALGSRPADLFVAAFGGVAVEAFISAAAADVDLLAGGVLLTRAITRSAVSRSIN